MGKADHRFSHFRLFLADTNLGWRSTRALYVTIHDTTLTRHDTTRHSRTLVSFERVLNLSQCQVVFIPPFCFSTLVSIVSRIAIVKPEKARAVEDHLIRMAQGGRVTTQITEDRLIELLEQVNQQTRTETKIVVCFSHPIAASPPPH